MGEPVRKIIHIDMDCFYAAIEIRDQPELRGRPVAVGGTRSRRGVLTTCSYEARAFGIHSAMPTYKALRLCPDLIVLPVRFEAYREESRRIREIFGQFTRLVEPLSLDEAYLDVSHWNSTGSALAWEIRARIARETGLTASAGIAPNKLLAKIASDWRKPDGQFEIRPKEVEAFMRDLPVERLWGVGARTADKLHAMGVKTCGDLQGLDISRLGRELGKVGYALHAQSRGRDDRPVVVSRERKSLSNERTFAEDLTSLEAGVGRLADLHAEVQEDLAARCPQRRIRSLFVKLKFSDFSRTTAERQGSQPEWDDYLPLLREAWSRGEGKGVRLIGLGVRFAEEARGEEQLEMFSGLDTP